MKVVAHHPIITHTLSMKQLIDSSGKKFRFYTIVFFKVHIFKWFDRQASDVSSKSTWSKCHCVERGRRTPAGPRRLFCVQIQWSSNHLPNVTLPLPSPSKCHLLTFPTDTTDLHVPVVIASQKLC